MKTKDLVKELRAVSNDELKARLTRVRLDLAKLYLKKSVKRLENVALLRDCKKEIARINTIIAENEISSGIA